MTPSKTTPGTASTPQSPVSDKPARVVGARGKMAKSAKKREQILNAAAKVFWEKGYAGATLNDIAEEVGTQAGSFYYYFKSREDLVTEVLTLAMTDTFDIVLAALDQAPEDATPLDRVRIALKARVCASLNMNYLTLAYVKIIDQVPEDVRAHCHALTRKYVDFWREMFVAARDAGQIRQDVDLTLTRLFVMSSANVAMSWYRPGGPLSASEVADALITFFIDGIAPREPAAATAQQSTPKPARTAPAV